MIGGIILCAYGFSSLIANGDTFLFLIGLIFVELHFYLKNRKLNKQKRVKKTVEDLSPDKTVEDLLPDKKLFKDKAKFYKLMKFYFDEKMVREIYSTDYYCLLCFGEIFYMICPFLVQEDTPIGIFMDTYKLDELIIKEDFIIRLIVKFLSDPLKYKRVIYLLGSTQENKDLLKDFIEEKRAKGISMVDQELENKIKSNK